MAIKFICTCGKHLRARDDMAARRSVCPRCGAPVGIPARQPTHPGTSLGPLTPTERLRPRPGLPPAAAALRETALVGPGVVAPSPSLPHPAEAAAPSLFPRPLNPPRPGWHLGTGWSAGLLYPLRAWPLLLGLAVALTVGTIGVSLAWPALRVREISTAGREWGLAVLGASCVLFPLLVVGYACAFLDCTFTAAAAGEVRVVRWPGRDWGLVVRSGLTWLLGFLGGPLVPAGAAVAFWIHCGDPALVDWLILLELGVVAIGYWLLAVLAVHRRDRLRDANPLRVAMLVDDLGYGVVLAVAGAAVLALAHGLLAFVALGTLAREPATGGLLLTASWFSGLFWATNWFRLLGVWCRRQQAAF